MKLSITNFKAISNKQDFDLSNINIISGQNSGGKSSLIHAILFLKQNIDNKYDSDTLRFNKPLLSLGNFQDITSPQVNNGDMRFEFNIDINNLFHNNHDYYSRKIKNINKLSSYDYIVTIESKRQSYGSKTYIKNIEIKINYIDNTHDTISFQRTRSENYSLKTTNYELFESYTNKRVEDIDSNVEIFHSITNGDISLSRVNFIDHGEYFFQIPTLKLISNYLNSFFSKISYIGPLRESPKNYYYFEDSGSSLVGNSGEFTPQFLAKYHDKPIIYSRIDENGTIQEPIKEDMLESIKYWICDYFKLASNISLDNNKEAVLYQINLQLPNSTKKISINNVGFGISQLLPIIVQSMAMPSGSILILEQPEIHLHPTVQAKLFDFFNSLHSKGISTIIETHSDHLITRLRRRVAESDSDLANNIHLIFVSFNNETNKTQYNNLSLDDLGNLNYWPDGFFDQYDQDVRAILKAQITKKRKMQGNNNMHYFYIEPSTLIWDQEHFNENPHLYDDIISGIISLIELEDIDECKLLILNELIENFNEFFPFHEITSGHWPNKHEFINTVFSAVTKWMSSEYLINDDYFEELTDTVESDPDTLSYVTGTLDEVKSQSNSYLFHHDEHINIAFNPNAISEIKLTRIIDGDTSDNIRYFFTQFKQCEDYIENDRLICQFSKKHNPTSGWGSRMQHEELDVMQPLLEASLFEEDKGNKVRYALCSRDNIHYTFRITNGRIFHPYPVQPTEIPNAIRLRLANE